MRIVFVLVAHRPDDERVWYQEAESLKNAGGEVFVISTRAAHSELANTYTFNDRNKGKKEIIQKITSFLIQIKPEVIICDNPIAILAAKKYKQKIKEKTRIIYDITEWYPSKKNLSGLSFIKKLIKIPLLIFLSYYTAWIVDGFIFGECDKAKPFRILFPWKKCIYLPYYADPELIPVYPTNKILQECTFLYAGNLTIEKGFDKVIQVVKLCAETFPKTKFILHIISSAVPSLDLNYTNLFIKNTSILPFFSFCKEIGKADLFFDLRKIDMENTRCLPIKLFYYMAAGRPVIYSDLKAISKEVPEINQIGTLVDPLNIEAIVSQIRRYLEDENYYEEQCLMARKLAEQKYNWKSIENRLINFILKDGKE